MLSRAIQFASRNWSIPVEDLKLSIEPIGGGLESRVVRAALQSPKTEESRPNSFVVKELRGLQRRETRIYRELWRRSTSPPAVRLLGTERTKEADYLYLEEVTQESSWPWKQSVSSIAVCQALARLHDSEPCHRRRLIDWNYESDLMKSAGDTLTVALNARDKAGVRYWRRIGDLRRVVAALPKLRTVLVQAPTFIHGDVHPGNVIVRPCEKGRIAFIDWARARVGSPLEDVASWLHSLGCWEPEARRRHDTLLRAYLEARCPKQTITTKLRSMYWYASASNGLSGAIRYHLLVLNDLASSMEQTSNSTLALRAWERVIRRVAAILATIRIR